MTELVRKQFCKFHKQNPHIYEAFEILALQAASKRQRFGARAIFEVMRWETQVRPITPNSKYKIQDHWSPYYARLFEQKHPQHKGFFQKKDIQIDELEKICS